MEKLTNSRKMKKRSKLPICNCYVKNRIIFKMILPKNRIKIRKCIITQKGPPATLNIFGTIRVYSGGVS